MRCNYFAAGLLLLAVAFYVSLTLSEGAYQAIGSISQISFHDGRK